MPEPKSPVDQALDLFVYAPVGLAVELSERLPAFAEEGRKRLQTPLGAARFVGQAVVDQARRGAGKRLQDAVEPYFGGPRGTEAGRPAGEAAVVTDDAPTRAPDPTTLPISGYTTLSATQIIDMLGSLSPDQLQAVEDYERTTRRRKSILDRIAARRSEL